MTVYHAGEEIALQQARTSSGLLTGQSGLRKTLRLLLAMAATLLATVVALFLPAAQPRVDVAKLVVAATAVTAFFLFTAPYQFPGGSDHFTSWAEALAHGTTLPGHLAQRDVGFPLLIFLSGYTITGSLIGITLIHATFAILMPLLIYRALYRISQPVAFYTALCLIASMAPFFYMKLMYHDQTYIFLTVLTAVLLACYLQTSRYAYLYLFTVAVTAASISRPAGNILFPIFLVIAYVGVRGRLMHYLICALIFAGITAGYLKYRYDVFDMAHQPSVPSYTGQQVFYNAYINSAEFGVTLSPALGPNFTTLIESFRAVLQPNARESRTLSGSSTGASPEFMEQAFYRYSVDEIVQRALQFPNWEYYNLMSAAEPNDQVFLKAALEIFHAYPWYPIAYTLRNTWHMLAKPGYAHTRYNLQPFGRVGLSFPPLDHSIGTEGTGGIRAQAQREVAFAPLSVAPARIPIILNRIAPYWLYYYQTIVSVTLGLMTAAWLGLALYSASLFGRSTPRRRALSGLLAENGLVACIIAASALLMYNIVITSAFADPDFRYHHFIVPLRIFLSGYGLIVMLRLLRLAPSWNAIVAARPLTRSFAWTRAQDGVAGLVDRFPRATLAALAFGIAALFTAWAMFMIEYTGVRP